MNKRWFSPEGVGVRHEKSGCRGRRDGTALKEAALGCRQPCGCFLSKAAVLMLQSLVAARLKCGLCPALSCSQHISSACSFSQLPLEAAWSWLCNSCSLGLAGLPGIQVLAAEDKREQSQ